MRVSPLAITAYVALLQPVVANFDVYMVDVYDAIFNSHSRVGSIDAVLVAATRHACVLKKDANDFNRAGRSSRPSLDPASTFRMPPCGGTAET